MADRVLDQWLQQQIGHQTVLQYVWNADLDDESIAEAGLLYLDITVDESELFAQGHLLTADLINGMPQQFTEGSQHTSRTRHIVYHQRRNCVQRIEEEVG